MLIINGVSTEAKKLNSTNATIIIKANVTVSSLLKTFLNILLRCSIMLFHIIYKI